MNKFGMADNSEYLRFAEDLKRVSEERKQRIAVELLDRAIKEFSTGTFSLAVLGMVKRGKSTFCNALLGADSDKYAPVGKTPVSNAITFFEKGVPGVSVSFFDGTLDEITLNEVPSYITEQQNPGNRKQVSYIAVKDQFPRLPEGVILMDTPGEGSFNLHHDDLLFKYLPMVDAAVFLITAYSPVTESELAFLQKVVKCDAQKIFFAINQADRVDEEELNDAIEHNLNVLSKAGILVGKIYPISAKMALEGDWIASGMNDLFNDIDNYLAKEKYRVPRLRFLNKTMPVITPLYEGIREEIASRTKSAAELKLEIENLTTKRSAIEEERKEKLSKVRNVWVQSQDKLAKDIESVLQSIESQMKGFVDTVGFFNCTNAKLNFCCKFSYLINSNLKPLVKDFEDRITACIRDFPVHFNGINIETNPREYNSSFLSGTSCGGLKIALTAWATVIVLPIGALIHLNTVSSIKSDLCRQLPVVMENMRERFRSQLINMESQREETLTELENLFDLEVGQTVLALENALKSQGNIDRAYDEQLAILKGLLETLQKTAEELQKGLEG